MTIRCRPRPIGAVLPALALCLLPAACSQPAEPDNAGMIANVAVELPADAPVTVMDNGATPQAPGATVGGDGSAIQLSALTATDIDDAKLVGELACSFTAGDSGPLLLAKGNVASKEPAQGVVRLIDYVEPVWAPGGFDAMTRGGIFSGKGKTIAIALTGPAEGGGESPEHPATLTFDRADGARRVIAGRWSCGP